MIFQDEAITALRIRLHELSCPTCGGHELEPALQCDYYPDGCLWLVRCSACRAQYHLDHRSGPALDEDVHTGASAAPATTAPY
jgi:hypothetical protein